MSRRLIPHAPAQMNEEGTPREPTESSKSSERNHHGRIFGGCFEEWGINYANYNIADLQKNGVADELTLDLRLWQWSANFSGGVCHLGAPLPPACSR